MCGALEYRLSTTSPFPIAQEASNPRGTIQRKLLKRTCSKLYLHSHWQKSWNFTNSPSRTEDKGTENRLVRPPHARLGSLRPFIHTLWCNKKQQTYIFNMIRGKKTITQKRQQKPLFQAIIETGREEYTGKKTEVQIMWKQKAEKRCSIRIKKKKNEGLFSCIGLSLDLQTGWK